MVLCNLGFKIVDGLRCLNCFGCRPTGKHQHAGNVRDVLGSNVLVLFVGVVLLVRKTDAALIHVHQVALWVTGIVVHVAAPNTRQTLALKSTEQVEQVLAV